MTDQPSSSRPITNYAANSNAAKQRATVNDPPATERKKLERVTTTEPVRVKKPLGKRIAESFTGDDIHSVGSFVLFEVIVPETKKMIVDIVTQGIERTFFGSASPRSSAMRTGGFTPYNRMSVGSSAPANRAPSISQVGRARHNFSEIVLEKREEAQDVLDRLHMAVEEFNAATVGDLYDLVGITGNFNDNKWGWTTLSGSSIRMVRGGYVIDLPDPQQLD